MTRWAILPVKPFRQSKSRLAGILSVEQRADLIQTFFKRTLLVLQQVSAIEQVLVISSDPTAWDIAKTRQALVLPEERPLGLNTAVSQAVSQALQQGATSTLILPADLPFIQAADVWQIVRLAEAGNGPTLVISTDLRHDGTNALLLSPPHGFTFHYGPGSRHQHLREARRLGLAVHHIQTPHLQFDLDTVEDWQVYHTSRNNRSNAFPGQL